MRAYMGWIFDLNTGKTIYSAVKKPVVAVNRDEAIAALKSESEKELNDAIHFPVVIEIGRLPEGALA